MIPIVARMKGVEHCFGPVTALAGVDLTVQSGEVLAVLGPNGAGKTTAINLLLGTLRVQAGWVEVFGEAPGAMAVRRRRGAMLQRSGLPETLTVEEHVALFRSYYPAPLASERLMALAGIEELRRRPFARLSGGQRQRVLFALAMAGDPELVFLDEPTTGLDIEARRRLWDQIRALRAEQRTVVLTTHYLEEADALADRIIVLHRGRIIAEGTPAAIKARAAGRRIRCLTAVELEIAEALPGVLRARRSGRHLELLVNDAETVLRRLLAADEQLSDLTVTGAALEDAFLALTSDEPAAEAAA